MKYQLVGVVLSHVSGATAALYDQVVQTKYGPVQGFQAFNSSPAGNLSNWQDVTVFKGIPYGASTAGQNRWRPPQNVTAWTTTLNANAFGAACPQSQLATNETMSEDCLKLNIWTAATDTAEKRPVILWSYPAGGSSSQLRFDGGGMATKGVIFVSYNYRTSALGWLAHPQLNEENLATIGKNVSGNWGMLDQFAALRWVYDNIDAFGGDGSKITLVGQSMGSAAVYHGVNSPLTKGLVYGAIAESGTRSPLDPLDTSLAENYRNLTYMLDQGVSYFANKSVTTIAEMRALPYTDLIELTPLFGQTSGWAFTATLDYYAMPDTYYNTLANGLVGNCVPYITGNTLDESGAQLPINITVQMYLDNLNTTYGSEWAQKFLALYPASNDTEAGSAQNDMFTDRSRVSTWLYANEYAKACNQPIWTYLWDHAPPGQNGGAFHMSEISYALNNLYGTNSPWQENDYAISERMSAYWTNFIKTGNPNTGDSYISLYSGNSDFPTWDPSVSTQNATMRLGNGWGPEDLAPSTAPQISAEKIQLIVDWFNTAPSGVF